MSSNSQKNKNGTPGGSSSCRDPFDEDCLRLAAEMAAEEEEEEAAARARQDDTPQSRMPPSAGAPRAAGKKPGDQPAGPAEPAERKARYRPLPRFQPFPLDFLPPVVRDYVTAAAAGIGCEPVLVVNPTLAVLASCIGNSRALILKPGWNEWPILWALAVVESGKLKTPAHHAALKPVHELQYEFVKEHKLAMAAWEETDAKGRGPKPKQREIVTGDSTIQKFGVLLSENPHGVLYAVDELDAWFQNLTSYRSSGTDRPQWMQLHTAGVLAVHRVTRDGLYVPNAAASICGTIQPSTLQQALNMDALLAGLGARFLMSMPPPQKRKWTDKDLPEDLVGAYQELLRRLLGLSLQDEDSRTPHFLGMTAPAKARWIEWYNVWGERQSHTEGVQASCYAKLEAAAARLALIYHVVSEATAGRGGARAPVSEESMLAGIRTARWYAYEAGRVYQMLREEPAEQETRKLVDWIKSHGGRTTTRALQRANQRKWASADLAKGALNGLAAAGLGRWMEFPNPEGGLPILEFELTLKPEENPPDEPQPDHQVDA
jgi:hypothetical protein